MPDSVLLSVSSAGGTLFITTDEVWREPGSIFGRPLAKSEHDGPIQRSHITSVQPLPDMFGLIKLVVQTQDSSQVHAGGLRPEEARNAAQILGYDWTVDQLKEVAAQNKREAQENEAAQKRALAIANTAQPLSLSVKGMGKLIITPDTVTLESRSWTGKTSSQSIPRADVVGVNRGRIQFGIADRIAILANDGRQLEAEQVPQADDLLDMFELGPKTALLCMRGSQGLLSVSSNLIHVDPDFNAPRSLVTGVMIVKQEKKSWDIAIHAKVCLIGRLSGLSPADAQRVISQLGEWNENMPRGTMEEVTEHYISQGYALAMRDSQGAQLSKKLSAGFESVTRAGGASVYLGYGVSVGGSSARTAGVLHESLHNVYVRSDGSVIERIAST